MLNKKEVSKISETRVSEIKKVFSLLRHPVEFKLRDIMQIVIGSAILAVPVGFTEETWKLGENLPMFNIIALLGLSLLFISLFVYHNYYKNHIKESWDEFIKRVIGTYLVSVIVVGILLTIIQRAPWSTDLVLALKRTIIVAFPASMSAAVADMIK
jgi:uncharacterized membrane protein